MDILEGGLDAPDVIELLRLHLESVRENPTPGGAHVLDRAGLKRADITFWSAWDGAELAGCCALKELDVAHGEIKSMRTAKAHLRRGVAAMLLKHILQEAQRRGYRRLSLETGSMEYFEPARRLYRKFGFRPGPPFTGYVEDPNSVFMTMEL